MKESGVTDRKRFFCTTVGEPCYGVHGPVRGEEQQSILGPDLSLS